MARQPEWPNRFNLKPPVGVIDADCWARPCIWPGYDKGSFTPGVGYTRYHDKPIPVCMTRHSNGCPRGGTVPHPSGDGSLRVVPPAPDPESARCCDRPAYRNAGRSVWRCTNCGAEVPAFRFARALNALPIRLND